MKRLSMAHRDDVCDDVRQSVHRDGQDVKQDQRHEGCVRVQVLLVRYKNVRHKCAGGYLKGEQNKCNFFFAVFNVLKALNGNLDIIKSW